MSNVETHNTRYFPVYEPGSFKVLNSPKRSYFLVRRLAPSAGYLHWRSPSAAETTYTHATYKWNYTYVHPSTHWEWALLCMRRRPWKHDREDKASTQSLLLDYTLYLLRRKASVSSHYTLLLFLSLFLLFLYIALTYGRLSPVSVKASCQIPSSWTLESSISSPLNKIFDSRCPDQKLQDKIYIIIANNK